MHGEKKITGGAEGVIDATCELPERERESRKERRRGERRDGSTCNFFG
jgi:hypothetical protein